MYRHILFFKKNIALLLFSITCSMYNHLAWIKVLHVIVSVLHPHVIQVILVPPINVRHLPFAKVKQEVEATQGEPRTNHHTRGLWEGGEDRTWLFERKPKESLNGEPLGAGLHTIYTTVHEGWARLSVGLCTVHDIIVELGARLYDIKGGSVHSTRHRARLL